MVRQSMYDTFGDKRALFLKALEVYVSENVRAINVELRAPWSPLAAIRSALIHFSERKDLSSTDSCMGIKCYL
jgi:TetR/AcrR family transcriptional repressor of nem operon